ncbi:MAG: ferritin, partial [Phycisphaerae bacterium]
MPLSKSINQKLNEQIVHELAASHTYLAMACYLDELELLSLTKLFRAQAAEEHEHAMKILDYMLDAGGAVKIGAIEAPHGEYTSVLALAEAALKHEEKVTAQIHEIV